jgi:hypothetical protein
MVPMRLVNRPVSDHVDCTRCYFIPKELQELPTQPRVDEDSEAMFSEIRRPEEFLFSTIMESQQEPDE